MLLQNQIPLNLSGVAPTGGGNVSVTNADKLTVTGGVIADTGGIALNVGINGIDLNAAASKVQTAGTVLLNPTLGGVTESGASQGVIGGIVSLTGAGTFALDNANNDAGTMFRAAVNGKLTFRDANDLTLDPAAGVSTTGQDATLFAGLNFTAQNSGVLLVNAGAGAVRIVPGAGAVGDITVNFTYDAEVIGSSVTFGSDTTAPASEANRTSNNFKIAPSKNATIVAFGNNPTRAQLNSTVLGDSYSPLLGDPNIRDLNLVLDPFDPNTTFSGTYFVTMNDSSVRQLKFRQIESLGGLGYRALVAQTGNQQYSIRLQKTVLIPQPGSVLGQALQSSPFVVSPTYVSLDSTYTAPRLAFGDVNGDGLVDLVIANGANNAPLVTIINGATLFQPDPIDPTKTRLLDLGNLPPGAIIKRFYGFPDANGQPVFRGGLYVAVKSNGANVPGDIVLGPGVGGGPVVQVWGISNGFAQPKSSFFAFEPSFRGGVTVATGDYNGDGLDDIIVGTGPGGAPRVQVFDQGKSDLELPVLANFFAYDSNFRGGVFVAAGNFNGKDADGKFRDDIATAPGYGGGPHIQVFGNTPGGPVVLASFFAWNPTILNGLQTLGSNANNGVGSISFGAPELILKGVGDPKGRQELLVGSARGTALQLRRFTFADGASSPKQTYANPISLYNELTNPAATDEFGTLLSGIEIRDPMTKRVLGESEIFDGGSVAGFGG